MKIHLDKWDMEDDYVDFGKYVAKKPKWESLTRSYKIEATQTAERLKAKLINEFLKEEMGNLTKEELRKAAEEMFPERFI